MALHAVRTNGFAGGAIALQTAQRMPMLTAEQHRAVYQAMQAMTADLVARAEKGDAKAKADLAAIERTRSLIFLIPQRSFSRGDFGGSTRNSLILALNRLTCGGQVFFNGVLLVSFRKKRNQALLSATGASRS